MVALLRGLNAFDSATYRWERGHCTEPEENLLPTSKEKLSGNYYKHRIRNQPYLARRRLSKLFQLCGVHHRDVGIFFVLF